MKQKIKNALEQGYKNLGLSDEAFERVATFGETFITSEDQIANFVKGAESILKAEQSAADKVRTELNAKIKGLEGEKAALQAKLNGNQDKPQPEPPTTPQPNDMAATIAAAVADAVSKAVNPLQEKLTAFETQNAKANAIAELDKFVSEWDYAKGFPKESELSKRIAMKVYKAGGETMTGEELIKAFREEFDPAVKERGVTDFTKPFKSEGDGGDINQRFADFAKRQQERLGQNAE